MNPIGLTKELVAIPSVTGAEHAVTNYLAGRLETLGYRVNRQPVEGGRENLYAYRDLPTLVFSTHLDTVPPFLTPREDDEWLYGRGTCDAKGLAAAMVAAAERLAALGRRDIGLLFVVGEENGSQGAKAAASFGPKGRFIINGEPTENRLCIGQKGALRINLDCTGKAAHSAYPHEGDSAIERLLDALARIRAIPLPTDELLGASTLNVGTITGGVAPNVVPPFARAELMIRTVAPSQLLRERIQEAAGPGVDVAFPLEFPSYKAKAIPGWTTTVVSYASDLPFLVGWGEGYQLGPGTIRVAHTDHECIRKSDLLAGVDRYIALARHLLGAGTP